MDRIFLPPPFDGLSPSPAGRGFYKGEGKRNNTGNSQDNLFPFLGATLEAEGFIEA
jgi:hypothetical protein